MSRHSKQVVVMTEIAILTALGLVFDFLFGLIANTFYPALLPYGGNIGLTMVPIMLISYRRGIGPGLLTGFLVGVIQLIYGGHFLEFFQYILDYPIPFTVLGFAGVFSRGNKNLNRVTITLGATLAGLLRYFSHFLAGVTFWKAYVPEEAFLGIKGFTPFTWSLFYNGLYMIPSIILTVIVLLIMYQTAPNLFNTED